MFVNTEQSAEKDDVAEKGFLPDPLLPASDISWEPGTVNSLASRRREVSRAVHTKELLSTSRNPLSPS